MPPTLKIECIADYAYGNVPGVDRSKPVKVDKETGHVVGGSGTFKAGTVYELNETLALRLLRDNGPADKRSPGAVHFRPHEEREALDAAVKRRAAFEEQLTAGSPEDPAETKNAIGE